MSADTMVNPSPVSPVSPGPGLENSFDPSSHGLFHFANASTSYTLQDPSHTPDNLSLRKQEQEKQASLLQEITSESPTPTSGWEAGSISQDGSISSNSGSMFSLSSSWTYEVASMITASLAVAATIAVLAHYDNKPLSSWPSSITLNAVIAILATVSTAGMGVPLSSGLSQLKWVRFKQGRAPLIDMEYFDNASRGPLGALSLLFRARGGIAGSFGAAVVVITLLLSPFAQQIATYPIRTVEIASGAINYRALGYGLNLKGHDDLAAFVPILPIKSAVYYGLFSENNKPWLNLPFECPSGNCTFGEIETLAVCQSCVDMTEYLTRYCPPDTPATNLSSCGWQLPSGAVLNTSSEVFSMTSSFPGSFSGGSYSTIMRLYFMGTESFLGPKDVLQPWAKQCTLSTCVQRLHSTVQNGELNETILTSYTNNETPPSSEHITALSPVNITSPITNKTYSMGMPSLLAFQSWFTHLFRNGTASRNPTFINQTLETAPGSPNVLVNLTVGISSGETFFDHDIVQSFYWNYYEYPTGIEMLMSDLAVSMTTSIRAVNGQKEIVNGTTLVYEPFVQVRWGFVAVPVVAVVLTGVFLSMAAWWSGRAGIELWKTSALAMLFYGLDEVGRGRFEGPEGLDAKRREAKGVSVTLERDALRTDEGYE